MKRRRILLTALAVFGVLPLKAAAHPLGNFTVNHLTQLQFSRSDVKLRYVLDLAEIPAYQTARAIASNGKPTNSELARWAHTSAVDVLPQLQLTVEGKRVPLSLLDAHARTRPGAGNLATLYLVVDAAAALPKGDTAHRFTFSDESYPGRIGWHDVIVSPQADPTRSLTKYPNALSGSPRNTTSVHGTLLANGSAQVDGREVATTSAPATESKVPLSAQPQSIARSNELSDMIAHGTGDWKFVALTFFAAIVLGALHALEPGHGKTLLAISLVGSRATIRQAGILATALTIAHTIGVLALGVALNLGKGYFVPETIYPWITLVSGIVIAIIGARAVAREVRKRQGILSHSHGHGHAHAHAHADPAHDHGDMDDAEHAMLHAIPGTAPLRFGPTVWAAMSGGIAPCPAALVVLLAAFALNEVAYGIFVIVAFSVGLAATLTGLGIAVVRGASWLQKRPEFDRLIKYGPMLSASIIAVIGAIMIGQGFSERGVTAPPLIVSLIVLLAIGGYVYSHPAARRHVELG